MNGPTAKPVQLHVAAATRRRTGIPRRSTSPGAYYDQRFQVLAEDLRTASASLIRRHVNWLHMRSDVASMGPVVQGVALRVRAGSDHRAGARRTATRRRSSVRRRGGSAGTKIVSLCQQPASGHRLSGCRAIAAGRRSRLDGAIVIDARRADILSADFAEIIAGSSTGAGAVGRAWLRDRRSWSSGEILAAPRGSLASSVDARHQRQPPCRRAAVVRAATRSGRGSSSPRPGDGRLPGQPGEHRMDEFDSGPGRRPGGLCRRAMTSRLSPPITNTGDVLHGSAP